RLGGYPAPFREMLGIEVVDFLPLPAGTTVPIRWSDGTTTPSSLWTELWNVSSPGGVGGGAAKIAEFASGVLDGRPAVTRHEYGNGNAHYLATRLDATAMAELLRRVGKEAGVTPVVNAPAGVEAIRREAPGGSILFLMNHSEESVEVRAAPTDQDLRRAGGDQPGGGVGLHARAGAGARAGVALALSGLVMLAGVFLIGIGFGALDLRINQMLAYSVNPKRVALLNGLNGVFGIGAVAAPILVSIAGARYGLIYAGGAAVAAVALRGFRGVPGHRRRASENCRDLSPLRTVGLVVMC